MCGGWAVMLQKNSTVCAVMHPTFMQVAICRCIRGERGGSGFAERVLASKGSVMGRYCVYYGCAYHNDKE